MLTCIIYEIWMKRKSIKKEKHFYGECIWKKNNYYFMHWNNVYLTLPKNVLTYVLILK